MSGSAILTGAPGTGKTSVLDELSTMLEADQVPFGAIETEQLARGWPWLGAAEWIPQLAAVISLQRASGRDTFIIVATTETEHELRAVAEAVGGDRVIAVCLAAAGEVVARRIAEREPDAWPGNVALIEHARQLAEEIPRIAGLDVVLDTEDREPASVARELRRALTERGVLTAGR